ncbi:MAG: alcohol dehydrogenase catalytic domain-containing protein, partial [Nitrospinota bacterium]
MKAAVLTALGAFSIEEREPPEVEAGGVRVRVEACGVCPSDVRVFRHGHARVRLPHVLGHEVAGVVEEVGEGTQGCRPGDRVSLVPRISCGQCSACRKDLYSHCPHARTVGFDLPGGFAEQVLIPAPGPAVGVLIPVGAGVSCEEAAL